MFFYGPPPDFTHRASLYCVPCFVKVGHDEIEVLGTNWLFDVAIVHLCPVLHFVADSIHVMIHGESMAGWPFHIKGPLE